MRRTKKSVDRLVEELLQAKIQQRLARIVQRERRKANKEMAKAQEILALPEPSDFDTVDAEVIEEEDTGCKPLSFRKGSKQ